MTTTIAMPFQATARLMISSSIAARARARGVESHAKGRLWWDTSFSSFQCVASLRCVALARVVPPDAVIGMRAASRSADAIIHSCYTCGYILHA